MDSYQKWQIRQSDCEISCNFGKKQFIYKNVNWKQNSANENSKNKA